MEAKSRQVLAGESTHGHRHIDESLQLVPTVAQAVNATGGVASPKKTLRASEEAGKIMGVGRAG